MTLLDTISVAILLGSLLVLAGILSSLIALRFGAPLLLVFLLVGMLAGEGGPGGLKFSDVGTAYTVGSIALALILFDGGLRTRLASFRSVLAPAVTLATAGVLVTTLVIAPVAKFVLGIGWTQALLVGSVVASTDAAAVFFLINARGLRLRPRVRSTLEVESGTNDPFAVFLTLLFVQILLGGNESWSHALLTLARDAVFGCIIGYLGGRLIVVALNRLDLPQGLHAPFVAVMALVVFAFANAVHASGFLAVYLAGLVMGNRQTRAHNSVVVFLDAVTWLAQIVMFVLLGLLVWPQRLGESFGGAVVVALVLMLIARPAAVFLCLWPFGYQWREKLFMSWVGLRGAVAIFLASIPLLVGLPSAYLYFDVAFVVVLFSLAIQGWTVALAAAQARHVVCPRRPAAAPRRARSARPARARDRRLSGARQQPVPAPRADPELGAADHGGARRGDPHAGGSAAAARGRLPLSAGAAGKGAGARPFLRRHAAAARGRTRACSATSSCPARRRSARWPTSTACRSPPPMPRCRWPTISPSSSAARPDRRYRRTGADRAAGAHGRGRPRHHRRPAAGRAGAARDGPSAARCCGRECRSCRVAHDPRKPRLMRGWNRYRLIIRN